jgi:hypothetical protein
MSQDLDDIVHLWRALIMLGPIIILVASGLGGLSVWYLKKLADSVESLVRGHERILTHIENHGDRLERLEDKVFP